MLVDWFASLALCRLRDSSYLLTRANNSSTGSWYFLVHSSGSLLDEAIVPRGIWSRKNASRVAHGEKKMKTIRDPTSQLCVHARLQWLSLMSLVGGWCWFVWGMGASIQMRRRFENLKIRGERGGLSISPQAPELRRAGSTWNVIETGLPTKSEYSVKLMLVPILKMVLNGHPPCEGCWLWTSYHNSAAWCNSFGDILRPVQCWEICRLTEPIAVSW